MAPFFVTNSQSVTNIEYEKYNSHQFIGRCKSICL